MAPKRPPVTLQAVRDARHRGDLVFARSGYQELSAGRDASWELFVEWAEFLVGMGAARESVTALQEAARRFPNNPAVLNSLGLALQGTGDQNEAVRAFETALRATPGAGAIAYNLGNARRELGDIPGAMAAYVKALELGPPVPEMFNNLGLLFQETGEVAHALTAYRSALGLDAAFLPAALNLGYLHIQERQPALAAAVLESALHHHPGHPDVHWLLSHALLVMGEYERGWKEYEWRWEKMRNATYRRKDASRQWTGGALAGKRILLYAEQGLGDAIQCARYIPMVAAAGGIVVVECQPELVELMRTVRGVADVVARGEEVPPCECECPLMSLPGVFGTTLATIPNGVPYVFADPAKAAVWEAWCREGGAGRRVGLVWAGNPAHRNDVRRSLPASHLRGFMEAGGVRWVSLQKGERGDGRLEVPRGVQIEDVGSRLHDLSDTAALLMHLDLVITVDTAVAHLAGAMGRPVWLLIPYAPDWRWLLEGEGTGWYPTARLYRQPTPGNWDAVIARVVAELALLP
jgi:tetratricopeptide (TPR) repeat protein